MHCVFHFKNQNWCTLLFWRKWCRIYNKSLAFNFFNHLCVCHGARHLQTFRHDGAEIFECNLFGNVFRFDVFILFSNQNHFALILPAVLFDPMVECIIFPYENAMKKCSISWKKPKQNYRNSCRTLTINAAQ